MNKREHKKAPGFSNFGFSTILLAFVMICIVTISALSLLTANSDYKLSQKVAEKNTSYFDAEKKAYKALAEVDSILALAYKNSRGTNSYYQEVESAFKNLSYGSYDTNEKIFTYEISISENQSLEVSLRIQYPQYKDESFYEIKTWKSIYEIEAPEEGTLDLID